MRYKVLVGLILAFGYIGLSSFSYFEKYYGVSTSYQEGIAALPLPGGGYLVSGAYNSSGNPSQWNSYILTLNNLGDTISTLSDVPQSGKVVPTLDNNLVYIGGNNAGQAYDTIYITKTTLTGNIIWRKKMFYGVCHNTVSDILPLADGSFLVTGFYASQSCSSPTYAGFITKLDNTGNTVWEKFITGEMNNELYVLKALHDGNFAAFGWTNNFNENMVANGMLLKFDPKGEIMWTQYYGDNILNFYGYGMDVLADGNFVLLGYDTNMTLIKTDTNGSPLLYNMYGASGGGSYYKINTTIDGGLAILGSEEINGQFNSVMMKTDLEGNILWSKTWPACLRNFNETSNGSFILTGYANYLPQVAFIMIDTIQFKKAVDTIALKQYDQEIAAKEYRYIVDGNNNTVTADISNASKTITGVKVYPNPATNTVYIEFNNAEANPYRLEIYTLIGELVKYNDNITSEKFKIDGSQLPKGAYAYILTGAGNNYNGIFVLQ